MINWPTITHGATATGGLPEPEVKTRKARKPKQTDKKARATRAETFSPSMKLHEDIPDDDAQPHQLINQCLNE